MTRPPRAPLFSCPAIMLALVAVLSPVALSCAAAAPALPESGPISCSGPIAPSDTLASLQQRYGDQAMLEQLPGAEGETITALVLYQHSVSMDRRVEITFAEMEGPKAKARVSAITLRDSAKSSRWSIAGLSIGASLADVQKANGRAFQLSGFGWDYGGFVTDWKDGALAKPQPGGCTLTLRFSGPDELPASLAGDGVKLASDQPRLVKWAPKVSEITLNFPQP